MNWSEFYKNGDYDGRRHIELSLAAAFVAGALAGAAAALQYVFG
ncbi:hypothetical protein M2322_002701 [Rhodoblastus acidophilus]|nr:hypothetical protein [Rhodoblastus acidophilus]MCW2317147.1 hypothetical protein [Rhodoblastus acidophilus]